MDFSIKTLHLHWYHKNQLILIQKVNVKISEYLNNGEARAEEKNCNKVLCSVQKTCHKRKILDREFGSYWLSAPVLSFGVFGGTGVFVECLDVLW